MLNEFVYCPRLFYYEHVEGVFVHNADTLAGRAHHKRVDSGKGTLPPAKSPPDHSTTPPLHDSTTPPPDTIHSRSVSLFSDRLGVTAKLDLVESRHVEDDLLSDTKVVPVEYKKGHPREGDDGMEIWPADRMQLGLQILILHDNGYACDEGFLYYRETRQRITLEMTPELETWIEEQIAAARTTATGPIPAPLDHSPKCPRCSLVSVCLPDETRALHSGEDNGDPEDRQLMLALAEDPPVEAPAPPQTVERLQRNPFDQLPEIQTLPRKPADDIRRLIAPNPDTRALYLNSPGQFVGKKDATLQVKEKKQLVGEFRLLDLHHVALFGPVQISTGAVHALCEKDIPITYFSLGGWFYGMTRGHSLKNVFTRIEQFRHAADPILGLSHARLFVHGKIRNQRTLLMRNHRNPPKGLLKALKYLANTGLHTPSLPMLLGIEGTAANLYFSHFKGMLKDAEEERSASDDNQTEFNFAFDQRNRRPPRDPVNALLSLLYSLLAKDCTLAAYAVGFDPYVGFLHQPRFGRPALALDLMEEFRPLVADSVAISLVNNRMLSPSDFVFAGKAVNLNPKARRTVFIAYEKRLQDPILHPVFGYRVSYRRAIELQARLLAKAITGEVDAYYPFMTR